MSKGADIKKKNRLAPDCGADKNRGLLILSRIIANHHNNLSKTKPEDKNHENDDKGSKDAY